jgi:hypothetical protein
MKLKNVPKSLSSLPQGYTLDAGDKRNIKKYREKKATKRRNEAL